MRARFGSISRRNRQTLVVLLATCLVTCFSFGFAAYAESGSTEAKSKATSEKKEHRSKQDSEHVYVLQKPDGSPYERIVNNDGSLAYDGYEDADLPVAMDVTYYLDGEEIPADKLAGKSGHVTIEIEYSSEVEKDGTPVPFMALTGAIFSSEDFSNVSVAPGKVVDDGANMIAVGFAFPGVKEGLALNSNLLTIPDKVYIQADTDNYDVGEIYTVVTNDAFKEIDLSEVDNADDLIAKIDEMKGAAGKLADGTEQLKDGADKLNTGAQKLNKGSKSLVAGAKEVADGNGQLKKSVPTLTNGVGELAKGSKAVADGNAGLLNGLQKMYGNSPKEGTQALKAGSKQVADGAADLKKGTGELAKGAGNLEKGAKSASEGASQVSAGVDQLANSLGQTGEGLGKLSESSSDLNAGAGKIAEGAGSTKDAIDAAIKALEGDDSEEAKKAKELLEKAKEAAEGTSEGASGYEDSVKAYTGGVDKIAKSMGEADVSELVKGAHDLKDGTEQVSDGAAELAKGVEDADEGRFPAVRWCLPGRCWPRRGEQGFVRAAHPGRTAAGYRIGSALHRRHQAPGRQQDPGQWRQQIERRFHGALQGHGEVQRRPGPVCQGNGTAGQGNQGLGQRCGQCHGQGEGRTTQAGRFQYAQRDRQRQVGEPRRQVLQEFRGKGLLRAGILHLQDRWRVDKIRESRETRVKRGFSCYDCCIFL